ncbi:MAG TPA: type VI secretion system protein TssL [Halothiobacillaceae bacterium]|nr:type VI secretion system protein TssL [Halothiobacillaceae bacterium]
MSKKKCKCPPPCPGWLTTFADMATLLLVFFVLMLSMSVIDVQRYERVIESFHTAVGGVRVDRSEPSPSSDLLPGSPDLLDGGASPDDTLPPLDDLEPPPLTELEVIRDQLLEIRAEELRKDFEQEIQAGEMEIETTEDAVILRITEQSSFPSGSATLQPGFLPVLNRVSEKLVNTDDRIVVTGYTDNVPIRTAQFRSNWDLSAARAVSVLTVLEEHGVEQQRLSARGMGENNPVRPNDSAENRAANRRVEIALIPKWLDEDDKEAMEAEAEAFINF